jgi:hypothetical protein
VCRSQNTKRMSCNRLHSSYSRWSSMSFKQQQIFPKPCFDKGKTSSKLAILLAESQGSENSMGAIFVQKSGRGSISYTIRNRKNIVRITFRNRASPNLEASVVVYTAYSHMHISIIVQYLTGLKKRRICVEDLQCS